MEGDVFDELTSPLFVLAIANVTDVTITKSGEEESCVSYGYSRTELVAGSIGESFRVEVCDDYGPITDADLAETPEPYGFAKGASVLVGLIKPENGSSGLRYAVPDCWGPLHLRLDDMSKTERDTFLAEVKQGLLDAGGAAEP